ncbi:MAG: flavodoxin [Thermoplasmata archaeon]|nr:MAG: flavodoxin [Thermoplasmata archaeon]
MKKLVVFYSYEGNTKFIAKTIAESIDADVLELKPVKEMNSKGFMKFIWGGQKVIMKQKPELNPFNFNPVDYDVLFIGTPVWAFTYTPALRTFFSKIKLENKKIAIFCCHEGGMKKTLDKMKKALTGNTIIGTNDFFNPLYKNKEENELKTKMWAEKIIDEAEI